MMAKAISGASIALGTSTSKKPMAMGAPCISRNRNRHSRKYGSPIPAIVPSRMNGLMADDRLPVLINTIKVTGIRNDDPRLPSTPSLMLACASMPMTKPCTRSTPKNFQGSTLRSASRG
ncbi:hypothetical protein D3C71_1682730 [compost metagenome]